MTLGEAPSREKVRRGTWILGLLAVVALAVFFTDELERELAAGPTLWVVAEETRNLSSGAPVWLSGHRVGRVAGVDLRDPEAAPDHRVVVKAVIREDQAGLIRAGASAVIRPAGLLEPAVLSLRPGRPEEPPYDFSDTLEARSAVSAGEVRAEARRAQEALDTLRRAERRLLALADTGAGTLPRYRRDEDLRARLRRIREELDDLAAAVGGDAPGAVRLIGAPDTVGPLAAAPARADSLAARLEAAARRWSGLADRVSGLRERADRLGTRLREARGSAGRLLHDAALRRELEELRRRMRETQAELLADPFRWLRFGIF